MTSQGGNAASLGQNERNARRRIAVVGVRQAVTFSDSKIWLHALRSAIPQGRSAGIRPSTPTAFAVLNSSALSINCSVKLFHDSIREAVSRLSLGTK